MNDTTTTAERVAEQAGNDGSQGISLDLLEAAGGRYDYEASTSDADVWTFADDSAIVICSGGWDVRAELCTGHCWDGAGCHCAD